MPARNSTQHGGSQYDLPWDGGREQGWLRQLPMANRGNPNVYEGEWRGDSGQVMNFISFLLIKNNRIYVSEGFDKQASFQYNLLLSILHNYHSDLFFKQPCSCILTPKTKPPTWEKHNSQALVWKISDIYQPWEKKAITTIGKVFEPSQKMMRVSQTV